MINLSLKQQVNEVFLKTYTKLFGDELDIRVENTEPKFGHFASNIALVTSSEIGKKPMEIAKQIQYDLLTDDIFETVEVKEPGFINVRLSQKTLSQYVTQLNQLSDLSSTENTGKRMIIDYSHPNIGKPMGVHHLMSTVIGDSIKKIYRFTGWEVIADNFIGDMGTQFGKLIYAIKEWGDMKEIERSPIDELLKLYVKFHVEEEINPELKSEGRKEYKLLEEGDHENNALLRKILVWSKAGMQNIYDILGVSFDYFNGESFYSDKMEPIVALGIEKGVFEESEGALVYKMSDPNLSPAIIKKQDGTTLYLTRDMARIKYWQDTWKPDLMLVVVDSAQSFQFQQLFEIVEKLELTPAKNIHVEFGRMSFPGGQMSTRKGNILLIEDLIKSVKEKVDVRITSLSKALSKSQQKELTDVIAINSIKYAILRNNRKSNIVFDMDNILSLEGNSAPYLCYSGVRMRSVINKCLNFAKSDQFLEFSPIEQELVLHFDSFKEVVLEAQKEFLPSTISTYCYKLAQLYNNFYAHCPVAENGEYHESRLVITQQSLRLIQTCFDLLGMKLPEKM